VTGKIVPTMGHVRTYQPCVIVLPHPLEMPVKSAIFTVCKSLSFTMRRRHAGNVLAQHDVICAFLRVLVPPLKGQPANLVF
jgi:hypothetical protein